MGYGLQSISLFSRRRTTLALSSCNGSRDDEPIGQERVYLIYSYCKLFGSKNMFNQKFDIHFYDQSHFPFPTRLDVICFPPIRDFLLRVLSLLDRCKQ